MRGEFGEGEGGEVAAVERARVEVKDGLSDGGCGGGDDGFRQAGADDDEIEVRWFNGRVRGGFGFGHRERRRVPAIRRVWRGGIGSETGESLAPKQTTLSFRRRLESGLESFDCVVH